MTARLVFLPILGKLVRMALLALTGVLVHRGYLDTKDTSSIADWAVNMLPAVLAAVPGVWWSIHAWAVKFKFIADLETALHLPVTGRPNEATLVTASANTAVADMTTATASPFYVPTTRAVNPGGTQPTP